MFDNYLSSVIYKVTQLPNYNVIRHNGAVFNIKILNKEVSEMVEKLQAYIDELMAKKNEILTKDHSAEIEAEVAAFREDLTKKIVAENEAAVAKIDSDIECINNIIAREYEVQVENESIKEGE